jgi:hypothetical protein
MIKKGLLALGILVALFSSVGMVSACESHLVNVQAHVENAVRLQGGPISYGTVFPEEFLIRDLDLGLSTSFSTLDPLQDRVMFVTYEVWVGPRPKPGGGNYPCLADAMYIGIDAADLRASPAGDLVPVGTCNLTKVASDSLSKEDIDPGPAWVYKDHDDYIHVAIDVPVFEEFWNPLTDALGCVNPGDPEAKPSGLCEPTVVLDPVTDADRYDPGGTLNIQLHAQVIVQVTCIGNEDPLNPGVCIP